MAKQFTISKANPIPFRLIEQFDDRYNTIPFDLRPEKATINGIYYQKWQINDATKIQFLSDFTPETDNLIIKVFNCNDKSQIAQILPSSVVTAIKGQTFKVYEAEFDFSDYGYGFFYAEISFTDENDNVIVYQSQPIHVAPKWQNTLLFEYRNSFNDFSVIFDTEIVFNFRVEAVLADFTPQFDDEIYVDQVHTSTQLSATPFQQFKLTVKSVPDWMLEMLNYMLSVDTKQIDGDYYEKTDGAKWDVQRAVGYDNTVSAAIDLVKVSNPDLSRYEVDNMAEGEYTLITKRVGWKDNAINRTLVGKLRINSVLRRIDVINKGLDTFVLKAGSTDGGEEFGQVTFDETVGKGSLVINEPCDSDTTLYLTGLAGSQTNVFVIWDQDDEDDVSINGGTSSGRIPKNTFGYWQPINNPDLTPNEQLQAHWDLASGLGKSGTLYENCAICDGRNGTQNELDAYAKALGDLSSTGTLNQFVGANSFKLVKNQLPDIPANFGYDSKGGSGGVRVLSSQYPGPLGNGGTTYHLGGPENVSDQTPVDNRPKSFIKLPYLAITD